MLSSPSEHDTNLTVAFESAWFYGLNVTSRPDAEWVHGDIVSGSLEAGGLAFVVLTGL